MSPRNGSYDVTYEEQPLLDRLKDKADDFRQYLATTCCACLASVPSFALVVLAVVLVMLLIASIPMAFAFSYMNTEASIADEPKTSVRVFRDHEVWSDAGQKLPKSILLSSSLLPPNISTCKGFGFACTSEPSHVIGTYARCDGHVDCADGSDEMDCHACQTTLACALDENNDRKVCLRGHKICDGVQQCKNGADEEVYCREKCASDHRKCKNSNICLSNDMICDGDNHCPDGDDEQNCSVCNNGAKFCEPQKTCIPKWKLCNGIMDCTDNSDELDCDCKTCSGNDKALCKADKKMCLLKSKVCDGVSDCPGGEDEQNCPGNCLVKDHANSTNTSSEIKELKEVKCSDGKFYNWRYGCGGLIKSCDGHCSDCNPSTSFDCKLNLTGGLTKCIHRSSVCNGVDDCGNNADEKDCDCKKDGMKQCASLGFSGKQKCYTTSQQCDGFNDCPDGEDEKNCKLCKGGFHCAKEQKCIPAIKRCDGVEDCDDHSDEHNCSCQQCNAHPFGMYMCSTGDRCFRRNNVCNPYTQCPLEAERDQLFCAVSRGGGQSYL